MHRPPLLCYILLSITIIYVGLGSPISIIFFSSVEALVQIYFTVMCVGLDTTRHRLSRWLSESGSGRTHQLLGGTHAIRHSQQYMSLVSHKAMAMGMAVQDRHPGNWESERLSLVKGKKNDAAIVDLLYTYDDTTIECLPQVKFVVT